MATSVEAKPTVLPIPQGFLHTLHQIDQSRAQILGAKAATTSSDPGVQNGFDLLVADLDRKRTALEGEFELPGLQHPEKHIKGPIHANDPMDTMEVSHEYRLRKIAEDEEHMKTWIKEKVPDDDIRIEETRTRITNREEGQGEAFRRIYEEFFPVDTEPVPPVYKRDANVQIPLPETLLIAVDLMEDRMDDLKEQLRQTVPHSAEFYTLLTTLHTSMQAQRRYLSYLKEFEG